MLDAFWLWTVGLAASAPPTFGLVVVITVALFGVCCTLLADFIFAGLRISPAAKEIHRLVPRSNKP